MVGEAWPKLYQPDYTDALTKILQIKPQAMYSCLWGGDLTAFIDQSAIYNLFAQMEVFTINVADYTILTAVKNLPKGIHSGQPLSVDVPEDGGQRQVGGGLPGEIQ